ncbi:MAG TPA: Fis family transcriptional regulator, partial [Anaeromyxobacter sp.]|nr:Fis family transcriptional regulator [Anaeromyxobacter sp.]
FALVDIARGTPPDLAAEREREGRYRPAEEEDAARGAGAPSPPPPPRRRPAGRRRRPREIVIHRARDRVLAPAPAAPPPEPPRVADLRRPEGRAVLERLVRTHGARRAAIARTLAAGWRRDDGAAPGEGDLAALLDHHGLARAFERRERDELLHALRAAGGVRAAAAERLALDVAGLETALARLGASAAAERIREDRRAELRSRGTLAERVHLLLCDEDRLRDLELLEEFEADLAARLPEHVRALRLGAAPVAESFARSLSLEPAVAGRVAVRFGLELAGAAPAAAGPAAPARRQRKAGGRAAGQGGGRQERPGRGRPAARPRGSHRGRGKR